MKRTYLAAIISSILVSAVFAAPSVQARTPKRAKKATIETTRGAFFSLSVADLEASSAWYAEKFGLTVVMDRPKADGVAIRVLEGGGLIVELIERDGAAPTPCATSDPTLCHGLFKVGFLVKNLDSTLDKLASRGVQVAYGPFPAQGNQRANAIIRDNAGNLIQLFEK